MGAREHEPEQVRGVAAVYAGTLAESARNCRLPPQTVLQARGTDRRFRRFRRCGRHTPAPATDNRAGSRSEHPHHRGNGRCRPAGPASPEAWSPFRITPAGRSASALSSPSSQPPAPEPRPARASRRPRLGLADRRRPYSSRSRSIVTLIALTAQPAGGAGSPPKEKPRSSPETRSTPTQGHRLVHRQRLH
jgi:hypothetical protein